MNTTSAPSTDPPDAPAKPATTRGCPTCGGNTRTAWRRGADGQLHEYVVCCECPTTVAAVPRRLDPLGDAGEEVTTP